MHFKIGFIHVDRRTLSLGTILSDRFDHILIGDKNYFFAENSEKKWFCFGHIFNKPWSLIRVWGSRTYLFDGLKKIGGGKKEKMSSWGKFCPTKMPIFYFFIQAILIQNFFVKMACREKTDYTSTKVTENARRLSSQIFDFKIFVAEIFCFKVFHIKFFLNP